MTEPRGYDPEGEPWYDDGVTPTGGRWALWDYEGRKWDPLPKGYDPTVIDVERLARALLAALADGYSEPLDPLALEDAAAIAAAYREDAG